MDGVALANAGLTEASYKMRSTPGGAGGCRQRELQHFMNERCDFWFLRSPRACDVQNRNCVLLKKLTERCRRVHCSVHLSAQM